MGCTGSRELEATSTRPKPARPAPPDRPKTSRPVPPAPSPEKQYETAASASLAGNANLPAFHGLLAERPRPLLPCEQPLITAPNVNVAVSGNDDSVVPPVAYDPQYGTLSVSAVIMTLRYTVIVSDGPEREGWLRKLVHDVFNLVHSVFNGWSETSEITKINNLKPEKEIEISEHAEELFEIIDMLYRVTGGRFDPTGGVLKLAVLDTLREAGRPPLPVEVNRYRFAVGWAHRVRRKGRMLSKSNANTIIDLDGISKGFCIDLIIHALQDCGYESMYVDWAGDIRAVGTHPSGRPWRSALVAPPPLPRLFDHWKREKLDQVITPADVAFYIPLSGPEPKLEQGSKHPVGGGIALATSGDYFQIQKYGYHHIVRPQTLVPMKASERSTGSVSVLATSCAIADGLATAAMTFDTPEQAADFMRSMMKEMPEEVIGFCVMGRGSSSANEEFRTGHFLPVTTRSSAASASELPDTSALDQVVPYEPTTQEGSKEIQRAVIRTPGRLTWGTEGSFIDIDSLTPCSMNPEPVVSFILPATVCEEHKIFSIHAEKRSSGGHHPLKFTYMSGEETLEPIFECVEFSLAVLQVTIVEDIALVSAQISKVHQGKSASVSVLIGPMLSRSVPLDYNVIRDDFSHRPVVDQAKEAFSELPSSVCVIGTTAADGTNYGLTATSVAITEYRSDLFMFNLMHSSTFFAAFGGEGAAVVVYCLASGHDDLAKSFAANSFVSGDKKQSLIESSMCVLSGLVTHVETVQDHTVVLAALRKASFAKEVASPLLWHRRHFTNFTN